MYPVQPIRWDDGYPVYTSRQVGLYGPPQEWGVMFCLVIELEEDAHPVTDYTFDRPKLRPIHHYSRVERFKGVLYQLLGLRGEVPKKVIAWCDLMGVDSNPEQAWESVRRLLKEKSWGKYYNRIPSILRRLGIPLKINFGDQVWLLEDVIQDFKKMSARFEYVKEPGKYFPNLRYIALRLLERKNVVFELMIPFIRTERKFKVLDRMWDKLKIVLD